MAVISDGEAGTPILGSQDADTINGNGGNDHIYGRSGHDLLFGGSGIDLIEAGKDNDTLDGGIGADNLYGEAGDDVLIGGSGGDTMDGGIGTDRVSYFSSASAVSVNLAAQTGSGGDAAGDWIKSIEDVWGSDFDDRLTGNSDGNFLSGFGGEDTLSGGSGADILVGYTGDDHLSGGTGADNLSGGSGTDTASYLSETGGVTVNLAIGLGSYNSAAGDKLFSIENIHGTYYDDVLIGSDAFNDLYGAFGDDFLVGGHGNDWLEGGGDADYLDGGTGADHLDGGDGVDTVSYFNSSASVGINLSTGLAQGGDAQGDTLSGLENIVGSKWGDGLTGNSAANLVNGYNGDDFVNAGLGADTINGSNGNDTMRGGAGADDLNGAGDIDTAIYDGSSAGVAVDLKTGAGFGGDAQGDDLSGIENLWGTSDSDALLGDDGDNALDGLGGTDALNGRGGKDVLNGGGGADVLTGGADRDVMAGGDGADRFDFNVLTESAVSAGARDIVADFVHLADKIGVEGIDASAVGAGDNAFSFIGSAAFTAEAQVRAFQAGAHTVIAFNTSGAGGAEMAIALSSFSAASLTAGDFIL